MLADIRSSWLVCFKLTITISLKKVWKTVWLLCCYCFVIFTNCDLMDKKKNTGKNVCWNKRNNRVTTAALRFITSGWSLFKCAFKKNQKILFKSWRRLKGHPWVFKSTPMGHSGCKYFALIYFKNLEVDKLNVKITSIILALWHL